jgi:signal transduction histidine kinase
VPILVAVLGILVTDALAMVAGMGFTDAARIAGLAFVSAAAAGVLGAVALSVLRGRSVGFQASVAALTAVAAVAAGAFAASKAMFIAPHDLDVLAVVLAASVTVGTLIALVLGRRVERAADALAAAARRIGEGDLASPVDPPATREFATLARELEAMTRRLDEASARERRLQESHRELVAWVSHDLRTPLAGMRAMTEALEDGVVSDPDAVANYHRSLKREVERLSHLVDELFELSVIESGTLRLQMERVSLSELVSDAIAATRPAADGRHVHLTGRLSPSAGTALEVAPSEFTRVLRNLLENAVRHTPSDGTVFVETRMDGPEIVVSVLDQCGGIPDEDIGMVFDTAFRGEEARTPADGRAGLGLAIARGIVRAHQGGITVTNVDHGCRFEVRLPVHANPRVAPARSG